MVDRARIVLTEGYHTPCRHDAGGLTLSAEVARTAELTHSGAAQLIGPRDPSALGQMIERRKRSLVVKEEQDLRRVLLTR